MTSVSDDDRVRFCGQCQKNVYNIAAMAPEEALDMIDQREGGLCMRLSRRPDGTLVTGDCRARLRYARRRGRVAFVCALVVVFAVQVWTQAFGLWALLELWRPRAQARSMGVVMMPPAAPVVTATAPPPLRDESMVMGEIAPPRPNKGRRQ